MSEDTTINLTLTVAEVNGVMQALGNLPFAQVVGLIGKIKEQAEPQVQAANAVQQ